MWTTDLNHGGMDGFVTLRVAGPKCQTGWHNLDDTWIDNFERGSGDDFSFKDVDIGPEVN